VKRIFCFTKEKFLSLEVTQQHKKCSEILREYALKKSNALFSEYLKLCQWMNISPCDDTLVKDRIHWHLSMSSTHLKESELFHSVRDCISTEPFLPIDIFCDRLRSLHNIGNIIRTCEAFRLGRIFLSENTFCYDEKRIQKSAMGTREHVSLFFNSTINDIKKPIIALETTPGAIPYYEFVFPKEFSIILGNEEEGCSSKSLEAADYIISIPLVGNKNSINVASAFAIISSEIRRQIFEY